MSSVRALMWTAAAALTLASCGPSINPRTKAVVDQWKAGLAGAGKTFPAAGSTRPELEAGQWAQFLEVDGKGNPAQITYKILGEEDGAVWMETERVSYYDRTVTKMLIEVTDWTAPEGIRLRRVITQRDDEPAQEMPPFLMGMLANPILSAFRFRVDAGATETVTVPAGTFEGAARVSSEVKTPFGTYQATTWAHGAVPVAGYVRSESADKSYVSELVAFGDSGAESAIEGPVRQQ